jgi:hypothetical protein
MFDWVIVSRQLHFHIYYLFVELHTTEIHTIPIPRQSQQSQVSTDAERLLANGNLELIYITSSVISSLSRFRQPFRNEIMQSLSGRHFRMILKLALMNVGRFSIFQRHRPYITGTLVNLGWLDALVCSQASLTMQIYSSYRINGTSSKHLR